MTTILDTGLAREQSRSARTKALSYTPLRCGSGERPGGERCVGVDRVGQGGRGYCRPGWPTRRLRARSRFQDRSTPAKRFLVSAR
jgi:hypothetical protein